MRGDELHLTPKEYELLTYLNAVVKDMYGRLPQAFATLPNQPLEIRRVPPEIQVGKISSIAMSKEIDANCAIRS